MRHKNLPDISPLLAALHSAEYRYRAEQAAQPSRPPAPFVTISRQAGAGGRSIARRIAERLNARDPADLLWSVWDNELVERVAAEYQLPVSRVAALGETRPSWLEEALGSLTLTGSAGDELTVYRRVAATIRALAQIGRVIIVGRGGAFVTADMPGGVHLRLVAPLDRRIEATARAADMSPAAAAAEVKRKDAAREAFYRRHWPNRPVIPENFTATLNTTAVAPERLVECVLALVPASGGRVGASAPPANAPSGT